MSDQTTQETVTTPEAPDMWVPDEPTSADAMARPESADETPGETPEVEAETQVEAEAEADTKTPASADKPQQQWNVPLQKMAQRQTTFEREVKQQITALGDDIKGVLAEIKAQGGQATPKQAQQLQDAKDDLSELFNEAEKADIIEGPMFAKFMRAVLSQQGKGSVDAETKQTLAAIQQKLEATERLTAQQAEQQQASQQWEAVKKANPGVDADALKQKAWEGIDDRYPDFDEAQKRAIAAERFDLMLAAEKAKVNTSPPTPRIDPASTTPPKSTKGTQTVATGASTGRAASTSRQAAKPPMYVPD